MTVRRFEDLVAWQKARALALEVYRVTGKGGFGRDLGLKDQARRAASSVMANIAEGFERYSRREFQHFLGIARGSAGELRSHLSLAAGLGFLDRDHFAALDAGCSEVSRLIAALRASHRAAD